MDDLPHNHVTVDHIVDDLRLKLHGVLVADDNARTLAAHWQGVANDQRKEIERLKGERDEALAALKKLQKTIIAMRDSGHEMPGSLLVETLDWEDRGI